MNTLLQGTAFITGAGSGIGQACAIELARSGCTGMLITDINETTLKHTVNLISQINGKVDVVAEVADITVEGVADRLVQQAASCFGRLDYAVNVAGIIGKQGPIHELELSNYKQVMNVNADSVWLCERAEVSQMLKQNPGPTHDGRPGCKGAIVNVASMCSMIGMPNSTPYTMSKHAVLGLVRSDSTTFASRGVRVNAVCPGIIATPIIDSSAEKFAQAYVEQFTAQKRLGTAQEVADVVAFLCSSRASYVSGAGFVVDGGHTAQ